jgi:hypothetical protein
VSLDHYLVASAEASGIETIASFDRAIRSGHHGSAGPTVLSRSIN